jgi:predicted phage replisome organizer
MADVKWIKIVTDIFDDEKMYAIECMPDGQIIQLVWLKILCLAGKCNQNGFLVINQKIAYTDEMLAKIFRMEIGVVQRALEIFQNLEMVEIVDDSYMISNWLMYQSGDKLEEVREKNRQRQKRFRESQKVRQIEDKTNSNVTNNVTNNVTPSYSYSNNSNISNYLYIKDNSNEDYIEFIRMNTDIDYEVSLWMKYKDERKPKSNNHYEETGLNSLLKKIHKMCLQYGNKTVVNVIEDSMSNNYQGIIWDNIKAQGKSQTSVFDAWANA